MEQLITLIKQQKQRQLSDSQIGVAVDFLYQLDYFHHLAEQYGKFYLVFLVQHDFIDIYNLRENRPLIDVKHLYILVQGKVNKNGFNKGTQIIVERDGHVHTLKDSVFLKISIEKMNHQPKLKQLQKSINKERFIIETLIRQSQQKQQLFKKLKQVQIFSQLSKYDFLQLVNGCQYKALLNGKRTHQFQKPVHSIIYIIEGQIKLYFPYSIQSSNPKKIDQFLQRYLKEKSKSNKKQITRNYSENQWIGIDEHYQNIPQKSYGIVMSVQAQLLYIPAALFDRLFNEKCNHTLFTKIEYMRKIRSQMLEKSTQTQVQKQVQILRWSQQQNPLSPQLRRKLSKYQLGEEFDEIMTNPEYDRLIQSRKRTLSINKPKRLIHLSSSPIQQSRNKDRLKNSLPVSLNKLLNKQYPRVNLFPQQYSKQFILPSQQREIAEAESKKNINLMMYLQPKHHRKACENKHCHSFNTVDETKFQNKLFSMAKNVTQHYAQNSTFYRKHFNKGDELCNLNLKTIGILQPSRKELLLKRKNDIYRQTIQRQMNNLGLSEFFLPGLKTKSTMKNEFKPMSPRKNLAMDLSQHMLDQNYNMESKNTLLSKHKQSSHTISIRNDSSRTVEFRNHSKTLFVKPEDLQRSKISRTIDPSSMSKKRHLKKQSSVLNIY